MSSVAPDSLEAVLHGELGNARLYDRRWPLEIRPGQLDQILYGVDVRCVEDVQPQSDSLCPRHAKRLLDAHVQQIDIRRATGPDRLHSNCQGRNRPAAPEGYRSRVRRAAAVLEIRRHLSQRELGRLVGLRRETVNIILQEWRERGLAEVDRRAIRLRAPDALRRIS